MTRSDGLRDIRQPTHALGLPEPLPQRRREQQDTAGEDRRNDARHVDLQRQVAGLRSEDLAALLTLGIVNGDPPLTTLDEDHERNDGNGDQPDGQQRDDVDITLPSRLEGLAQRSRQTGNDTGEDQHGDTVTDTTLSDLLAQPHHEHRTRHEGGDRHEVEAEIVAERDTLPRQTDRHADRLDDRQHQRTVTRVLADLTAPGLAFLLQLLQRRTDSGHELHDDRCRNVRHDPQRKDAHPLQCAAGEHVEQAKDGPFVLTEQLGQPVGVDPRHRDVRANTIDDDRHQQKTQTCPELGQPTITQRGESTLLSHLFLELAASCFDSRTRTLGGGDALESHRTTHLTGQHDFHTLHVVVDDVGVFEALQGYDVALDLGQLGRAHFSAIHGFQRNEAELRQTAVQRLLAAFETGSDLAAGAGSLTLVTTATGLAETATDTTARTQLFATGTWRRTQIVQLHGLALHTEHVVSLVDHAAILRSVLNLDGVTNATQAQTLDAQLVIGDTAADALDQRDLDGCVSHDQEISSTLLPRLAAIESGDCMAFRPLNVA